MGNGEKKNLPWKEKKNTKTRTKSNEWLRDSKAIQTVAHVSSTSSVTIFTNMYLFVDSIEAATWSRRWRKQCKPVSSSPS
jgi:hypothetical protein